MRGNRNARAGAGLAVMMLSLCAWAPSARAACQLNSAQNAIKHVVYIQFDNVHLTRDNPNVPSDMEQMPALLNFIEHNGTMDSGDHTVLISHTINGILTAQIGVYPDRDGIPVSNSYGVFGPVDAQLAPNGVWNVSTFFYWTDLVSEITPGTRDSLYSLLTETGQNMPASWAPFTRAGCDVGGFGIASMVLERAPLDVIKVFGADSPQAKDPLQTTHYIGEVVHCAKGSPICSPANTAVADILPDEPGGYANFQALYGGLYLNQAFGPLTDIDGQVLVDSKGNPGFPGFNPTASQTLGVMATMLEGGVPIVYGYIADLHDNQAAGLTELGDDDDDPEGSAAGTFGPGQPGYVAQAAAYNRAFDQFFTRLASDGIDKSNTLFVITQDEGDHFIGTPPSPPNCDGVTVPCTYPNGLGALDVNLAAATANAGNLTPFDIHWDMAPTIYVAGKPGPSDQTARQLERTMGGLTALNPYTDQTDHLMVAMADEVGERMLHTVTADAARTPTFTYFGSPDYFFQTTGSADPTPFPGFAWNHGGIQSEIARTFTGVVGPGVANRGILGPGSFKGRTDSFFSDHVDLRPTMMTLLGLQDAYVHDGRVISEVLTNRAMPHAMRKYPQLLRRLGQAYKAINAPFGPLAMASLTLSTKALLSGSLIDDQEYLAAENQIQSWTQQRDSLATRMQSMLEGAAFSNQPIRPLEAARLIRASQKLIAEAQAAASQ